MTLKKFYTGAGARKTPGEVLDKIMHYANVLEYLGYILRSGGQPKGADGAFEAGLNSSANKVIYKPAHWSKQEGDILILQEAYTIAAAHHPIWEKLPLYAKHLMARNVHAVLGDKLTDPSSFVICWTEDGMNNSKPRTRLSGGTGHTLSVANEHGVKIYNLNNKEDEEALDAFILSHF